MVRCRRCGTIYNDGARYCPKCGEPERVERGLFRAPMPDSSSGGESGGGAQKRRGGIFSVPLPFAVLVAGILMNPATAQWIFKIYLFAAPALGLDASSPSRAAIWAMSYAPSAVGMCVACAVLESSIRRHRESRLLRIAAVVIFMLTLATLFSTLVNSFKYISLTGAF